MAQILVRVDEDLAKEVRRIVKDRYGRRRGALSLVVFGVSPRALTFLTAGTHSQAYRPK